MNSSNLNNIRLAFKILRFELYLTTRNGENIIGTILQVEKDLDCVR